MNDDAARDSVEDRTGHIIRWAVGLAIITIIVYSIPVSPTNRIVSLVRDFLYLAAFLLPLRPLYEARRASEGSEKVSWALLFVATMVGVVGHLTWMFERFSLGIAADTVYVGLAQVGYSAWIMLMAAALALEVSSGGRQGVRAEMVVDLLLIGTIGLTLAWEVFKIMPLAPVSVGSAELMIGSANVVASLALGVAAFGILMSPAAMGGGAPRLLIFFSALAASVARMIFSYELVVGSHSRWLEPVWTFALIVLAAAGAERALRDRPGYEPSALGSRWGPMRPLIVPIVIAYGLSLLIREMLGSGYSGGNDWLAWGMLAVLIVARVTIAVMGSERQAQEVSSWEQRYATVVQALGEVVYEWNPATGKLERSGDIDRIFGYEPAAMTQATAAQALGLVHPDDREESQATVQKATQEGGWFEQEYRIRHADGTWRLIHDRGYCEKTPGEEAERVLGIMRDVTEARAGEERLRRAERLAALGGLAAGAAHEINNPLAAIALAAQVMQESDELPEEFREDVRVIARQASRAGEVVDRMLLFARRREGERSSVDLNSLIRDTLRGRQYSMETRGIKLEQNLSPKLPEVWVDPGQIERALLNLVINAERALGRVPEGQRLIKITSRETPLGAAVEVTDNGHGIPADILPRIFDPFFTTREVGEGTGLGLSMTYSIAQSHEGELRVDTREGEGTTFTLELPRTPEKMAAGESTAASVDALAGAGSQEGEEQEEGRSLRILLVEDEKSVRELATRFLKKKGHEVDEAESGKAALLLLQDQEYDGLVLDLRMPDVSGKGLYDWLKKHRAPLADRVVVITGDLASEETLEIVENMGRPFLVKPFDLDELLRLIEGVAQSSSG